MENLMKQERVNTDFMKKLHKKTGVWQLSVYFCTLKTPLLWKAWNVYIFLGTAKKLRMVIF